MDKSNYPPRPEQRVSATKSLHRRASRYNRPKTSTPMRLTERDIRVIKAVNDFRLMRQDQIQHLLFPSRNTAQVRLRKLWEHGFLRRRFLPVLGGIQTSPILYELDKQGGELLRTEFHYEEAQLRLPKNEAVSTQFILHTLGLAETRLAVELSCQNHPVALQSWQDEKVLKSDYDRVQLGNRMEAVLPDAYFVIRLPEQGRLHFFLEYDRGVENLKFFKKKMAAYVVYLTSSLCLHRYGTTQIRVLVVSEGGSLLRPRSRGRHLKEITEAVAGRHHFYFTAMGKVATHDVLTDPIWHIAGGSAPAALLPTAESAGVSGTVSGSIDLNEK